MSAVAVVAWTVTLAGSLLLCGASVGHLRHRRMLLATLQAQGQLPAPLQTLASRALGPAEMVLAAAVLGTWVLASPSAHWAAGAQALLTLTFAVYLRRVLRRRPGAPCGCFGGDLVSPFAVARAGLLGAASAATIALDPPSDVVVTFAAALIVALMLWVGPQAADLGSSTKPREPRR